jgi:3-methyladenine DNA glycosylase AlkD
MASAREILDRLAALGSSANVEGMARFGMSTSGRLGVPVPAMRRLAKEIGRDHRLAVELWETGVPEARIVASMIADPAKLGPARMDRWVRGFDSWDVCDQVCMNLFEKAPFARRKIVQWARREEEFVRRAAFSLLACVAWHDREAPDSDFLPFLPVIASAASDERNFVKKAANWALRTIGKRSPRLNEAALRTAREIRGLDSRAARWIAADAIRELESPAVRARLARRAPVSRARARQAARGAARR